MADETNIGAQLDVQSELNRILRERQKILEDQKRVIAEQLKLSNELMNAASNGRTFKGSVDDVDALREGMSSASTNAAMLTSGMGSMTTAVLKAGKSFSTTKMAMLGFADGVVAGFKGAISSVTSLLDVVQGIASTFWDFTKSVLAIPFRILDHLIDLSNDLAGASTALRQAYEDLRKDMGDFARGESRDVIQGYRDMRREAGNLGMTGLRLSRIYGYGIEGLANVFKEVHAVATALGPTFNQLAGEFRTNAAQILMMKKAMGLADDSMMMFARRAVTSGRSLKDTLAETGNLVLQVSANFGVSQKLVAKDVGEMVKDFSHFGNIAQKELVAAAVYTRKLGMEIKDLQGLIDKFDNFDDAAESVAKLAQSFGMSVDVVKIMNAQNPAERVEMLRKSFFAAGRTIETMTRQERHLLEQQTGLTGQALEATFSLRNQSVAYDAVRQSSEKAGKVQLSQQEMMLKLARSIERYVMQNNRTYTSFWDAFVQGMDRGLRWSRKFYGVMWDVRRALNITFWEGRHFSQMIIREFPGVKDVLQGLHEVFKPETFRRTLRGMIDAFRHFFRDVLHDPQGGMERLVERLKHVFGGFFDSKTGGLSRIFNGLGKIWNVLKSMLIAAAPIVANAIAGGLRAITAIITGTGGGEIFDALKGLFKAVWNEISPIVDTLRKDVVPPIVKALGDLATAVYEEGKKFLLPQIQKHWWDVGKYVFGYFGLRMLVGGVKSAFTSGFAFSLIKGLGSASSGIFKSVTGMIAGSAKTGAAGAGSTLDSWRREIAEKSGGAMSDAGKTLGPGITSFWDSLKSISVGSILKLGLMIGTIATAILGPFALFTLVMSKFDEGELDRARSASISMGLMMAAMLPLLGGMALLSKFVGGVNFGQLAIGLAAVGLTMIALGGATAAALGLLSLVTMPESRIKALSGAVVALALTSIPIVGAAALLGAAVAASGGIGLAVIGVGIATMMGAIVAMVGGLMPAITMMASVNLPDPESFKMVSGVVISLMKSSNEMISGIGKVMEIVSPGFLSTLFESGKQMEDNIKAATEFVRTTVSGAIVDLLKTVTSSVREVANMPKAAVEMGKVLIETLAAAANIMKAAQIPDALAEGVNSWRQSARTDAIAGIALSAENIKMTIKSVEGLFTTIIGEMMKLVATVGKLTGEKLSEYSSVITSAMSGVTGLASLITALQPTPDVVKAFSKSNIDSMTAMFTGMSAYFTTILPILGTLSDSVFGQLAGLIDKLGSAMSSIIKSIRDTDATPKQMQTATIVLEKMFDFSTRMVASVAESIKNASQKSKSSSEVVNILASSGDAMESLAKALPKIIRSMSESIPQMKAWIGKIPIKKGAVASFQAVASVFEILGRILDMFKPDSNVVKSAGSAQDAVAAQDKFVQIRDSAKKFADVMSDTREGNLIESVNKIASSLSGIQISKGARAGASNVVAAFDAVDKIVQSAKTLSGGGLASIMSLSSQLTDPSFSQSLDGLSMIGVILDKAAKGGLSKGTYTRIAKEYEQFEKYVGSLENFKRSVDDVFKTYKEIQEHLARDISVEGIARKLNDVMAITPEKFNIEHKALNITINLDLKIDADDLSKVLSDKDRLRLGEGHTVLVAKGGG